MSANNSRKSNNARKSAARRIMAKNPGMTYRQAWNHADPETQRQVAEVLAEMETTITDWQTRLQEWSAVDEAAAERAAAASRFHEHVWARFDGSGRLVELNIDPAILHSGDLATIITEVLQRTWDATMTEISGSDYWVEMFEADEVPPFNPDKPGVYSEASHDGTLKLAVNGAGRLLWCDLDDQVTSDGLSATDLSDRIILLHQGAAMRAWCDMLGLRDKDSGDELAPTDSYIARFRADRLTF